MVAFYAVELPITGVPGRVKHLPHNELRGEDCLLLNTEEDEIDNCCDEESVKPSIRIKKCVYRYEDKLSFTRILTDDSLVFDSHFESGNLGTVLRSLSVPESTGAVAGVRLRCHTYDLYMTGDTNASATAPAQWFYFRASNVAAGQVITFNIRNFHKPASLYQRGMRPLVYSFRRGRWSRACRSVKYFSTPAEDEALEYQSSGRTKRPVRLNRAYSSSGSYFTLSFTYEVQGDQDGDVLSVAPCYPYTYTDLQRRLAAIVGDPARACLCRRTLLCRSLAGNRCDLLTITAPAATSEELMRRPAVLVTARVHPGETVASLMAQGILDFLTDPLDPRATALRQGFVFKVVPMLNPDGVVCGNYRTSLAGCDLNRQWRAPDPTRHPTIHATRALLTRMQQTRGVALLLDLHGHSNRRGVFVYGCAPDAGALRRPLPRVLPQEVDVRPAKTVNNNHLNDPALSRHSSPRPEASPDLDPINSDNSLEVHLGHGLLPMPVPSVVTMAEVIRWRALLLPRLLSVIAPAFSLPRCSFALQKAKSGSLRMAACLQLGVDCAYTVEASLAGYDQRVGGGRGVHFRPVDLLQFGRQLCLSVWAGATAFCTRSQFTGALTGDRVPAEIAEWRRFFDPAQTHLVRGLLNDRAMEELERVTPDQQLKGADSDEDSDGPSSGHESARPKARQRGAGTKYASATPESVVVNSCISAVDVITVMEQSHHNQLLPSPRQSARAAASQRGHDRDSNNSARLSAKFIASTSGASFSSCARPQSDKYLEPLLILPVATLAKTHLSAGTFSKQAVSMSKSHTSNGVNFECQQSSSRRTVHNILTNRYFSAAEENNKTLEHRHTYNNVATLPLLQPNSEVPMQTLAMHQLELPLALTNNCLIRKPQAFLAYKKRL